MNKKIFRSCITVALLVLISSIALIMAILFGYFEEQLQNELKSEAKYISYAIEQQGISYINNFNNSNKRITLIAPDGNVLADTSTDASLLDNHSNRREFTEAKNKGSGTSIRYSNTLLEKTIYYALKLNDGNVLRISTTQYSIVTIFLSLIQPLSIVLLIAVILSFILSQRASKSIIEPLNQIDLEDPSNNTYEELTPLLNKISAQKLTISKQLKEAKQKQEEFRLITENMNEGLLMIDNKLNLLTINKSALKLLGIDKAQQGNVLMVNRTKNFRAIIEQALNGERAESTISFDEHNYSFIANPVFEEDKIIGAVIFIVDITKRAKLEQLRREFTSNVSHELKTPLTSISGFAEIMKNGDNPNDIVIDFSKSIYDEAQRLITLVNDIIKLSEFDEKNIQFEKENVDLLEISKKVIKSLKPSADKKSLKINLIGDSTEVLGVRVILEEMIYNLCDNAIKYNRDNGTIDIILNTTKNIINLTVRDTGIGIPYTEQDRIFERFYRVDKSHSKAIGGTGLGLSIVKHGAIYHNADISIESIIDKGTSITISFDKTH
jgi:sensor histidine kinase